MARVVLVTGGSGALGRGLVEAFAAAGDQVFFTYNRSKSAADAVAGATGAMAIQADLTKSQDVERMMSTVEAQAQRVSVLINNAGATQVMPFALIEEEDWDFIIQANLKSMFLVTRAVARGMIAAGAGVIINIGSIAGKRLLDVPVHYATAKAAVGGFSLALAKEFARYHIRVNTIIPGMLSDGVSRMVPEKQRQEYLHYCLAGRAGEISEVAAVALFLAGDGAGYINAQEIVVDGGI